MKILQIVPYFYPATTIGGTSSMVYETSKLLVKNGHQVTVYTTDLFDAQRRISLNKNQENVIDGIKVYYFSNLSNYFAYYYHFFFPLSFFPFLHKTIRDFDIIHLHEIYTLMHLWTGFLAKKNCIPYVISAQGTSKIVNQAGRILWKRIFYRLGGKKLLLDASYLIALTPEEKNSYEKLGVPESKVVMIPNGINLKEFENFPDRNFFRQKFDIPQSAKLLLFLGRIHPKKGIEFIIYALHKLQKQNKNLILAIVGPKEGKNYFDKIQHLIMRLNLKKKVIITDKLEGKDKLAAYSAADIFVLTSYGEGLPISALEAGACGLPLLLTKSCGLLEVEEYNAGRVVEGTVEDIVRGLQEIVSQKNFRNFYGEKAKKMVKERFNIEKISRRIEKLYQNVTNG